MSLYVNGNYKSPDILSKLSLVANKSVGFGIAPVGTIFPFYGTENPNPDSLMFCHGQEYDTEAYPDLYALLQDDHVPDLREVGLVGSGENATLTIATHTNYSVGDFEDDQVASQAIEHYHSRGTMNITGGFSPGIGYAHVGTFGAFTNRGNVQTREDSASSNGTVVDFNASRNWSGLTSAPLDASGNPIQPASGNDVTHGKQVAVEWLIVAKQASLDEFDFPIDSTLQLNSEWPVKNSTITQAIAGDIAVRDSLAAIQSDSTLQLAGKYAYAADTKYVYHYENDSWVLTDIKFGGAGIFYGTQAEWDALENKQDYEYFARTDDYEIDRIDNFGESYFSNQLTQTGQQWISKQFTISNVKPGRYLIKKHTGGSDTVAIIAASTATVNTGTIKWFDKAEFGFKTGADTYTAGAVTGVCEIIANEAVTITITTNCYSHNDGRYKFELVGMGV